MQLIPLPLEERVATGSDFVAVVTHSDLTDTTNAEAQIVSFPIQPKMSVECIRAVLDIPFQNSSSTANNTTTVTVGDGNGETALLTSTELNANGSNVPLKNGTGTKTVYSVADTVDLTFTPKTGTNLAQIDTGQLRIYFKIRDERQVAPPPWPPLNA